MHPNEELIRRALGAFNSRDLDKLQGFFSDDVVFYVPGRNRLSGVYTGKRETREAWTKQIEISGGTFRGEIIDAMVSAERLAALIKIRAARGGKEFEWQRLNVYRVSDGKFVEVRVYEGEQEKADDFFGVDGR